MIGFAGLSHLGTVSSIGIASKGFDVIAYDADAQLIADLRNGKLPVFEPGLDDLLAKSKSKITFTDKLSDLAKANVTYVSLDVKTNDQNTSDLSGLSALLGQVAEHIRSGATLVLLSQVPPGFTRKLPFAEKRDFNLIYQVETLIFGRAVERALYPERYIVGCANPDEPLPKPYEELLTAFGCPILRMRYESAELAKISINMFLAASVTVTNTLAEICEKVGADWFEIAPALKLDRRIGQYAYLAPGLGLSGGNIERDIATIQNLSKTNGTEAAVADAFTSNSLYRKEWALRTIHKQALAKSPTGPVAVWGLAYKQDTKSIKGSPSVALLEALKGVQVQTYDPQAFLPAHLSAPLSEIKQCQTAIEACANAQALVIMTPWSEFSSVDLRETKEALKGKTVIDPLGVLDSKKCAELGFEYFKLGKTGN